MEKSAESQNVEFTSLNELKVSRWNAFLENDAETIVRLEQDATRMIAELETFSEDCRDDLERLNYYGGAGNG